MCDWLDIATIGTAIAALLTAGGVIWQVRISSKDTTAFHVSRMSGNLEKLVEAVQTDAEAGLHQNPE